MTPADHAVRVLQCFGRPVPIDVLLDSMALRYIPGERVQEKFASFRVRALEDLARHPLVQWNEDKTQVSVAPCSHEQCRINRAHAL